MFSVWALIPLADWTLLDSSSCLPSGSDGKQAVDIVNMQPAVLHMKRRPTGHNGNRKLKDFNSNPLDGGKGEINGRFMHCRNQAERREVVEQSGWPSVEHLWLLIREAMLMRFIDNLIQRAAGRPAVTVCVIFFSSRVLLFFSRRVSSAPRILFSLDPHSRGPGCLWSNSVKHTDERFHL